MWFILEELGDVAVVHWIVKYGLEQTECVMSPVVCVFCILMFIWVNIGTQVAIRAIVGNGTHKYLN